MGNENQGCCGDEETQQNKSLDHLIDMLETGLFSIKPNFTTNRNAMQMVSGPSVGVVSKAIEDDPSKLDTLTMRKKSVAIVSNGKYFNSIPEKINPILSWYAAQIKFYSGLDAFPFAIRKDAKTRIQSVFKDLSNTFATILYLDDYRLENSDIPENTLVVPQPEIVKMLHCGRADAQATAKIINFLQDQNKKGLASPQDMEKGIKFNKFPLKKSKYMEDLDDEKDLEARTLDFHEKIGGKTKVQLNFSDINAIKPHFTDRKLKNLITSHEDQGKRFKKLCAIVTDGSDISGLGSIGPRSALPVLEGKSLLFSLMGDVDAVPICIDKRQSPEEVVDAILDLVGEYEAVYLEGFKAPESFEIEKQLREKLSIPVYHDEQHGSDIMILSSLINSLKVAGKDQSAKVVINGAGISGKNIANILKQDGFKNIIVCNEKGSIYEGREDLSDIDKQIAEFTNQEKVSAQLQKALEKVDVYIGLSNDPIKKEWIKKMNPKAIIFALSDKEISEKDATDNGAEVFMSNRSGDKNKINSSLVSTGMFRAINDQHLKQITDEMKIAIAKTIAEGVRKQDLKKDFILPDSLESDIPLKISKRLEQFKT